MFTSKKNFNLIDYQDSYYYRKKRKNKRYKWLKITIQLLFIIALIVFVAPLAFSNQIFLSEEIKRENAFINGPQLVFLNADKSTAHPIEPSFPVDINANIEINGLVAYAEIKQTFINPHSMALEGKYQFPLPENSAVKQLVIKMDNKEIIGEIMEKKAAKALYQKARKLGKKASLVEQNRPNIFTNKIANIPAHSTVVVTLKFIMPVSFKNGEFNLRLPLAITQRYQPKTDLHSSGFSSKPLNQKVPEPFKLSSTYFPDTTSHSVGTSQSSVNINLNSGVPIANIFSGSHKIKSRKVDQD